MKGVVRMAVIVAVAPLAKPRVTERVSPLPKDVAAGGQSGPHLDGLAEQADGEVDQVDAGRREGARPGASTLDSRQLSGGSVRNLSWLKLPSNTSGVPSVAAPAALSQLHDRGLEARSWPTPSRTPAAATAASATSASATVVLNGFSQKTCLPASAAATICAEWNRCGEHRHHRRRPRVGQGLPELGRRRQPARRGALPSGRLRVHAQHRSEPPAVGQLVEDLLTPPAEPDHRHVHGVLSPPA
jgi:hypothetical protein